MLDTGTIEIFIFIMDKCFYYFINSSITFLSYDKSKIYPCSFNFCYDS